MASWNSRPENHSSGRSGLNTESATGARPTSAWGLHVSSQLAGLHAPRKRKATNSRYRGTGLEPARPRTVAPKATASTNSATPAKSRELTPLSQMPSYNGFPAESRSPSQEPPITTLYNQTQEQPEERQSDLRQNKRILGERAGNRTLNLGIKSPLLCQLSYAPKPTVATLQAEARPAMCPIRPPHLHRAFPPTKNRPRPVQACTVRATLPTPLPLDARGCAQEGRARLHRDPTAQSSAFA